MRATTGYQSAPAAALKKGSVFVSRFLAEDSVLRKNLENVTGESLLQIKPIRYTHTPKSDWIFFSSRNAIKYFFDQQPVIQPNVRYAVFGKGSASMLESYGRKATFIGTGNDSVAIARKFIEIVDSEIVLFPQALDSLQTVQRWLPFNNIARNLFVYKSEPRTDFTVPETEILVFTSPSNVNAYYGKYVIKPTQKVIAIGTTTQLCLRSKGIRDAILPGSFDEESLLQTIGQVLRN